MWKFDSLSLVLSLAVFICDSLLLLWVMRRELKAPCSGPPVCECFVRISFIKLCFRICVWLPAAGAVTSKEITRAHYPGSGLEEILMDWVLFVDVFLAFGFETVLKLKPRNRAVAHKTHFYQKCSRSVWEQQRARRAGLKDRERKKWVRPRSLLCVCVCVKMHLVDSLLPMITLLSRTPVRGPGDSNKAHHRHETTKQFCSFRSESRKKQTGQTTLWFARCHSVTTVSGILGFLCECHFPVAVCSLLAQKFFSL